MCTVSPQGICAQKLLDLKIVRKKGIIPSINLHSNLGPKEVLKNMIVSQNSQQKF